MFIEIEMLIGLLLFVAFMCALTSAVITWFICTDPVLVKKRKEKKK